MEKAEDMEVSKEVLKQIAQGIEENIFNLFPNIKTKYLHKYRSLLFKFKHDKNQVSPFFAAYVRAGHYFWTFLISGEDMFNGVLF